MELQRRGWTPTQVAESATAGAPGAAPGQKRSLLSMIPGLGRGKVKSDEMVVFTRQLATIVNAGLPLMQGLDILAEQTEDANLSVILKQIGADVEGGETFSEALGKHPNAFTDLYVSMVKAGEASGNLDGILLRLAEYMEATAALKRKIRSAMTYPAVAFFLVLMIAGGLLIFVVPRFQEIYASFDQDLPGPTRVLIGVSSLLSTNLPWALLGAAVIFFTVRGYARTDRGSMRIDKLMLKLPVFGKLFRKVAVSRVTRTLSTLTRSGVPILSALEIVERTAGNRVFAQAVRESQESVRAGKTLAEPWEESGVFPPMVTRMISVGEKTGALETLLGKISDFYDDEVEAAVASLTSLIEPLLILFLGITVGFMVIALFLPILNLASLLQ
jgi:type IV pilus assembly protein PilC